MYRVNGDKWTEKYRPKSLDEVVGNEKAVRELRSWATSIASPTAKKAVILHGPPGCGKTSAAYALASEMDWEVIELNASDQRNEAIIKNIVGHASHSSTFSRRTRLIILDEADNLHGKEDRGGTRAITEIVKVSAQPVVLIANDLYRLGKALQRNCNIIRFQRLRPERILRVLRRICIQEGMEIEDRVLRILASNANGDLRSAINDLQALSISTERHIDEEDIVTGARDVELTIFDVLKKIYTPGTDLQNAISSLHSLDKTPEEIINWLYENLPGELMDPQDLSHALHYLGRADIFLGRARNRENFKFWRYASSIMACGVSSAIRHRYFRFKSPWYRGSSTEPVTDAIARKISEFCNVSRRYAKYYVIPFMQLLFRDNGKAVKLAGSLQLDVPQIAFLTGDAKRAEEIYNEAYKASPTVETEKVTKPPEAVDVKSAEVEDRADGGNKQRSLADFLFR